MNANVFILALCQALLVSGNILLVSVNALVGSRLSPLPELITLPVALQFVGLMCATIPASLVMARIGRKKGFYLGNGIGIGGAAACILALAGQDFWLFCLGTTLLGVGIGFGNLYRFAALEVCHPDYKSRAISMTLAGGVLAAVIGPNLAIYSQDWTPGVPFMGAFMALLGLYLLALLLISRIQIGDGEPSPSDGGTRAWSEILRQPMFFVAVITAMVGYGVMALVMTATPVAMQAHGFRFDDSAWVIQWHVLGMFVPSFFTGRLIERIGVIQVMLLGTLATLLSLLTNLHEQTYGHFVVGLLLLGIGWNFMFIGATELVSGSYRESEKAKSQAMNEFLVFSAVTLAAFASGWMQTQLGWVTLNLWMLPLVLLALLTLLWQAGAINSAVAADGKSG